MGMFMHKTRETKSTEKCKKEFTYEDRWSFSGNIEITNHENSIRTSTKFEMKSPKSSKNWDRGLPIFGLWSEWLPHTLRWDSAILIKDQAKTEQGKDFGLDIMIRGSSVISPDNHFKSKHTPVLSFLRFFEQGKLPVKQTFGQESKTLGLGLPESLAFCPDWCHFVSVISSWHRAYDKSVKPVAWSKAIEGLNYSYRSKMKPTQH